MTSCRIVNGQSLLVSLVFQTILSKIYTDVNLKNQNFLIFHFIIVNDAIICFIQLLRSIGYFGISHGNTNHIILFSDIGFKKFDYNELQELTFLCIIESSDSAS